MNSSFNRFIAKLRWTMFCEILLGQQLLQLSEIAMNMFQKTVGQDMAHVPVGRKPEVISPDKNQQIHLGSNSLV